MTWRASDIRMQLRKSCRNKRIREKFANERKCEQRKNKHLKYEKRIANSVNTKKINDVEPKRSQKELHSKDVNKWTEYGCCHANILTSFKRMQNSSHITDSTYTCELHGYRITIAMDSNKFLMIPTVEQWHGWNFAFGFENCACKCISVAHVLFETLNFVLFKRIVMRYELNARFLY